MVETALNSMGFEQSPLRYIPKDEGLTGLGDFVNPTLFNQQVQLAGRTLTNNTTQPTGSAGSWGSILQNIAQQGAQTAFSVIGQRFGGPQPGQYFSQTPQGSVSYNLPNPTFSTFPGTGGAGTSTATLVTLALVGGLLILMVKK